MNIQRVAIAVTLINLALFMFQLAEVRARDLPPVLRGRALEIVDTEGRVRASLVVHPAGIGPDGKAFSDTAILRLIDTRGRPAVKLATTEEGAGMSLVGDGSRAYVQLGTDGTTSTLRLLNSNGREQIVRP
jgi:hypothetical protein